MWQVFKIKFQPFLFFAACFFSFFLVFFNFVFLKLNIF